MLMPKPKELLENEDRNESKKVNLTEIFGEEVRLDNHNRKR